MCEGDGDDVWVPGDGFGVWGEAEADIERGGGCDVFEAGCPSAEDSGGEGAAADGGAGLQAQPGGGPGRSVDHSGDDETRGVLELEEAVYEGVQQSVIVGVEDADGEEFGYVKNAVDYVGGGERCPHNVGPVPVLPGVGRFAVAAAVGIPVAVTSLGRARSAPREEGEEGLLFIGGLCDGSEMHVGCRDREACGRLYEGSEGDKDDRGVSMRVAKVMKMIIEVLYEVCEGGEVWRSHSAMRDVWRGRVL